MLNGLNAPAWVSVIPAVNDGLKPSPQPESTVNSLDRSAGAPALHGVSCDVVVYLPQSDGVISAARGPPYRLSLISPTGSCGICSSSIVI